MSTRDFWRVWIGGGWTREVVVYVILRRSRNAYVKHMRNLNYIFIWAGLAD
jgi:hypothetical protein